MSALSFALVLPSHGALVLHRLWPQVLLSAWGPKVSVPDCRLWLRQLRVWDDACNRGDGTYARSHQATQRAASREALRRHRARGDGMSAPTFNRLTQPDWCNAPQPGNWTNACMRAPGHEGDHAVRKAYRLSEAFYWPDAGYPVQWRAADAFPDLWHPTEHPCNCTMATDLIGGVPHDAVAYGHPDCPEHGRTGGGDA